MGVNIGGRNMGASIGTRNVMTMSDNPPLPVPTNRVATIADVNGPFGTFSTNTYNLTAGWYEFVLRGGGGGGGAGGRVLDTIGTGGGGGNGGNGTTVRFNTTKRAWFVNVLNLLEQAEGQVDIVAGGGGGGAGGNISSTSVTNGGTGTGGTGGSNAGGAGGGGRRGVSSIASGSYSSSGVTNAQADADPTIAGSAGGVGGTLGQPGAAPRGLNVNIDDIGPLYGGTNYGFAGINTEGNGRASTGGGTGGGYPAGKYPPVSGYTSVYKAGIGPRGINLKADDTRAYQGGFSAYTDLNSTWYNLNSLFGGPTAIPGGGAGGNGGTATTGADNGESGGNGAKIKCVIYIPEPVTITLRVGGGGLGGTGSGSSSGLPGGNGSAQIYKLG